MREVMLFVIMPIILLYNFYIIRRAARSGYVPSGLRFVAILRGDREAVLFGYVVIGLVFIGWLFALIIHFLGRP